MTDLIRGAEGMTCSRCHYPGQPEDVYCAYCGAELPARKKAAPNDLAVSQEDPPGPGPDGMITGDELTPPEDASAQRLP